MGKKLEPQAVWVLQIRSLKVMLSSFCGTPCMWFGERNVNLKKVHVADKLINFLERTKSIPSHSFINVLNGSSLKRPNNEKSIVRYLLSIISTEPNHWLIASSWNCGEFFTNDSHTLQQLRWWSKKLSFFCH